MSRTRKGGRKFAEDVYPTPPWAVERFLEEWEYLEEAGPTWLEPAAGDGVIIRVVNDFRARAGLPPVIWTACDIRDTRSQLIESGARADDILVGDFVTGLPELEARPRFDVAIMNPPFCLTMEFVERCLRLARVVVMLQRLNFQGSEDRNDFVRDNMPDVYTVPNRISFTANGKADAIEHAWHTWGPHGPVGVGEIRVLKDTPLSVRKADAELMRGRVTEIQRRIVEPSIPKFRGAPPAELFR